jgi:hypothetical protein
MRMIANAVYFGFAGIFAVVGVGVAVRGVRARSASTIIAGAAVIIAAFPLFAFAIYMATCQGPCLP